MRNGVVLIDSGSAEMEFRLPTSVMKNLFLEDVEFKIEETPFGTWRKFMYPSGRSFAEYTSKIRVLGIPLLHYTFGKNPATGRRVVARGIVAVGRLACGIIAIGQAALGVIAIGQLAIGLLAGLGQASFGVAAAGQLAVGITFGLGQFAAGSIAIGQFGIGNYVLAQKGVGQQVWCVGRADPGAVEMFKRLLSWLFNG